MGARGEKRTKALDALLAIGTDTSREEGSMMPSTDASIRMRALTEYLRLTKPDAEDAIPPGLVERIDALAEAVLTGVTSNEDGQPVGLKDVVGHLFQRLTQVENRLQFLEPRQGSPELQAAGVPQGALGVPQSGPIVPGSPRGPA